MGRMLPGFVLIPLAVLTYAASGVPPTCVNDGKVSWDGPRAFLALLPCNSSDPHQRWRGPTFDTPGVPSVITNEANGQCLSTISHDPVRVVPCSEDETLWVYNSSNFTIAVDRAAKGTLTGKGVGACIDIMGGTGPVVDVWTCHPSGNPDAPHQILHYDASDKSLRNAQVPGLCVSLNRTGMNPYVRTPCVWPNSPPSGLPVSPSGSLRDILILENATVIPNFGADTFYPAEDRHGRFMTGFDDGGILDVSVTSFSKDGHGCTNGAAVVSGGSNWRNLTVMTAGGALREDGFPMIGRYTSANTVINGTWWTGTYGLGLSHASNNLSIEIGPFVGFRHSVDTGRTWLEPATTAGTPLNVSHGLFGERVGDGIKFASPHVVDHGPENVRSPDGSLYMVAGGCLSKHHSANCTWISGDGVFLARAKGFDASKPDSLNDGDCWTFWGGADGWTTSVAKAKPVFTWRGRVGAVTATWHPYLKRYLFCITAPTTHPWVNSGPFDTYVLEAPTLTGPFALVSYMPRFGQQAYFVSMPSSWMGPAVSQDRPEDAAEKNNDANATLASSAYDAVLTFSANFMCKSEGCVPNILNAGYGANLLPVRFITSSAAEPVRMTSDVISDGHASSSQIFVI